MDNYTREADAEGGETSPSASAWEVRRLVFVLASTRRRVVDVLEDDLCTGVVGWWGGRKIAPRLIAQTTTDASACARPLERISSTAGTPSSPSHNHDDCCGLVEGVVERCRRSDTYKSQRPTRNLKPTRFTDAGGKSDDKSDARTSVGGVCTSYTTCACAGDVHRSLLTRYRVLYYFEPRTRPAEVGAV